MFCKKLFTKMPQQGMAVKYKSLGEVPTGFCSYSVLKNLKIKHVLKSQLRYIMIKNKRKPVLKPLEVLQKYCKEPLLSEEDLIFNPTDEEIRIGQKLFLPTADHKIEFLKSAVFTEHLPDYDLPEVAFIGRSNVGKSSLISMLLSGVKDLEVRVSKTPGHTKTLNFFQLGKKLSVVDMPGYGHRMPDHYVESVETFLKSRQNLKMTFLLTDGCVGPTGLDEEKLKVLKEMEINHCIVMTKIDKAKPSTQIKNFMSVRHHRDQTTFCFPQPFLISSMTGDGVALLQAFVAYVSGSFKPDGMS